MTPIKFITEMLRETFRRTIRCTVFMLALLTLNVAFMFVLRSYPIGKVFWICWISTCVISFIAVALIQYVSMKQYMKEAMDRIWAENDELTTAIFDKKICQKPDIIPIAKALLKQAEKADDNDE